MVEPIMMRKLNPKLRSLAKISAALLLTPILFVDVGLLGYLGVASLASYFTPNDQLFGMLTIAVGTMVNLILGCMLVVFLMSDRPKLLGLTSLWVLSLVRVFCFYFMM